MDYETEMAMNDTLTAIRKELAEIKSSLKTKKDHLSAIAELSLTRYNVTDKYLLIHTDGRQEFFCKPFQLDIYAILPPKSKLVPD